MEVTMEMASLHNHDSLHTGEFKAPGSPQRSASPGRNQDASEQVLVKMLNDYNIDAVLSKKAQLTLECLIRLRKYQLVDRMEINPEGGYLVVVNPTNQERIRQVKSRVA